jgi:hypothetical protein
MGNTEDVLNEIRNRTDAHAEPLAEARTRLKLVRAKARAFPGARRTYTSGSIRQNTFIHPVDDGDGGVVLDRRTYPELGPEGGGVSPARITPLMCALLGPALREVYPKVRCTTSKRGPKILFGQPVDGQDPTVDMVIALTRRNGAGLWIPNLQTNRWEASDPERHVELFTSGNQTLRRTRRRVIRLLKAWNKQFNEPGFSSHNLTVWAWEFVRPGMGMATAFSTVLTKAAERVESGTATPDPAGVSTNVRLLVARTIAGRRLRTAADALVAAMEHDDDRETVLSALSRVFYKYIEDPAPSRLARKAAVLRRGGPMTTPMLGLRGPAARIACTRAYGALEIYR